MICGIGTDIVHIARIERALARYAERFAARILAPIEMQEWRTTTRPCHFLAKRFAAKEACAKAFGTGFRDGLTLQHIMVTHEADGRPILALTGRAAELMAQRGVQYTHVSVSDERDYAIAFVVLSRG